MACFDNPEARGGCNFRSHQIIYFPNRIARQPAPGNRIVSPILRQIEPAVGVVEHAGIVEVGERCGSLQRIAVGVVAVSRRARCAGEDAPHRADLVGAVVVRLPWRAVHEFAFGKIFTRHRVAGIARLADACAAPDVRCGDRATAAGRRACDGGAAAKPVIAECGRVAGLPRIGDADEPVLGVPGVIARAVGSQVAVGVEGQRLTRQIGELVEVVVARGLRERAWIDRRRVARLGDGSDEILRRRRLSKTFGPAEFHSVPRGDFD